MKIKTTLFFFFLTATLSLLSQEETTEYTAEQLAEFQAKYAKYVDSLHGTFTYQTGQITLLDGIATVNVPQGYKFLDAEQSGRVLTDIWGNPPSEVEGMLFPADLGPLSDDFTYAVEISYSEDGYVSDSDAKDIDYDELLEEMQDDARDWNEERVKEGYGTLDLVGWASPPFYDAAAKKLHWAKELKFEDTEVNTLNYNIRVLGRKGYLNLNAIGDITVVDQVSDQVDGILAAVDFNEGYHYSDFNPDLDNVAAYGIGGLIAGKVLAKAGFFAIILKMWKVIAVALFAGLAAVRKFFSGSRGQNNRPTS